MRLHAGLRICSGRAVRCPRRRQAPTLLQQPQGRQQQPRAGHRHPRYCHAPSTAALIYPEKAQDSGGGGFAVNLCLPCMVFFCFPSPQLIWIGCPLPLPEFTAGICYKHWALALLFWWSFKAHFYYGTARAKASRYKQHNGNGLRLMGKL